MAEIAVEFLCPDMSTGVSLDELSGRACASLRDTDAPLEHITGAEFATGLPYVDRFSSVGKACIACDHAQPAQPRQFGRNVLDEPVCKMIVLRLARHVRERQHRDRWPFPTNDAGGPLSTKRRLRNRCRKAVASPLHRRDEMATVRILAERLAQ